jgi:hypothetical protein
MAPRDEVNRALSAAGAASGPRSWGEARTSLFGGSTRRTAEAAGVSTRSVQRWIAAEEGRASQSRRPSAPRLANVGRRAALQQVRAGVPVSYSFAGDIQAASGGRRGRRGRVRSQSRDTGGFAGMDPEAAREWARAELDGDADALERLPEAMFGGDSDYAIPPSPDYPVLVRIVRFELRIG